MIDWSGLKPGTHVRFDSEYFEDSPELLGFIGILLPPANPSNPIRILWENGRIEEYPEKFGIYFEVVP